jgi:hypothetical protein
MKKYKIIYINLYFYLPNPGYIELCGPISGLSCGVFASGYTDDNETFTGICTIPHNYLELYIEQNPGMLFEPQVYF